VLDQSGLWDHSLRSPPGHQDGFIGGPAHAHTRSNGVVGTQRGSDRWLGGHESPGGGLRPTHHPGRGFRF
jgi:hypothetical protein